MYVANYILDSDPVFLCLNDFTSPVYFSKNLTNSFIVG